MTGDRRSELQRALWWLAMATSVLYLTVAGIAVWVWQDAHGRATENRALIDRVSVDESNLKSVVDEQSSIRSRNRQLFAISDRTLCLRIEALKSQVRASVRFNEKEFRATLTTFGIDPNSKRGQTLIDRSRQQSKDIADKFGPTKCAALPSVATNEPKP